MLERETLHKQGQAGHEQGHARELDAAAPMISIVIAVRDMARFIVATLASALAETTPSREVIVVDDGSRDETRDLVAAVSMRDPRVRIIARAGGEGVSVARNAGLDAARGQCILFLDGDDVLMPQALERLVAALSRNPSAPAAVGDLVQMDEAGQPNGTRASTIDIKPRSETLRALIAKNFIVNGGAMLIRTDAARATGGYQRGLTYGEDWEFWCRLALAGDFAIVDDGPVLLWRQRSGGANHQLRAQASDATMPALDSVATNPAIVAKLGIRDVARLARLRRIDLYWASARQELQFGSAARFALFALRGAVRYPDSVLRPRLVARFVASAMRAARNRWRKADGTTP